MELPGIVAAPTFAHLRSSLPAVVMCVPDLAAPIYGLHPGDGRS
ncbi:MAG: hypothetical protein ACYCZF_13510 [Anaerolineae bacterium]